MSLLHVVIHSTNHFNDIADTGKYHHTSISTGTAGHQTVDASVQLVTRYIPCQGLGTRETSEWEELVLVEGVEEGGGGGGPPVGDGQMGTSNQRTSAIVQSVTSHAHAWSGVKQLLVSQLPVCLIHKSRSARFRDSLKQ